jgi:ribonuclease HI
MLPDKLKLFFDGSCEPKNPGGVAGYGWRLVDIDGNEVATDRGEVCRGPEATNNIAEWAAVTNGLRYLKQKEWRGTLEILGDSQLVIRQLLGEYKVRKDTLIPYHAECMGILKAFEDSSWKATWIPREQNEECDRLSKHGD